MRYGGVTRRRRAVARRRARDRDRRPRPERRRQDHDAGDLRGLPSPQDGSVRVLGLDPVADAAALRPRVGVMLQSGGAWSGCRADEMLRHVAALHAHPLPVDRRWSSGSAWPSAGAPRTGGCPGASSSGWGWRWPWSGARSWCSSTSRPPGSTRRRAATPGTLVEELRADGVTVVLTHALHGRGRAARRPGLRRRPRPGRRVRVAGRAGQPRRRAHGPLSTSAGLDLPDCAAALPPGSSVRVVPAGPVRRARHRSTRELTPR